MMTRDQIRNIIDKMGISSRIDEDGDINFILEADDDFRYNVDIWLIVPPDGKRLIFFSNANGYVPNGDLLVLANRSNDRLNYPTAAVRGNEIRFEYCIFISEDVSEEFIINNIRSIVSGIWNGYRSLEKE